MFAYFMTDDLSYKSGANAISEKDVSAIDFFHDFLVFLRYLEKQPIQRTVTGNISLKDINALSKQFKEQELFDEFRQFGWKITSEAQVQFISQMKIIAESMYLIYKRNGKLFLSKNGKGFIRRISPKVQYTHMVLHFWKRVNWEYFSPSRKYHGKTITAVLQENQYAIWEGLLVNGQPWIHFQAFCKTLKKRFNLNPYYEEDITADFSLYLDIHFGLIERNLLRFGCVEIEESKDEHGIKRIIKIKPTSLGLYMFRIALSGDWVI